MGLPHGLHRYRFDRLGKHRPRTEETGIRLGGSSSIFGIRWLRSGLGLFLGLALLGGWASAASLKSTAAAIQVSSDPYSDAGAQHRTQVEPDTFASGSTLVGAFQVGRAFGGGASNIGWIRSADGGQRFTHGFLPGITKVAGGPYDRVSDPSVAYDAAHRVWLISSLGLVEQPAVRGAAVLVSRWHPKRRHRGRHWGRPITIAAAQGTAEFDKNWTVCDNSPRSPFYGNCYTEFDDFGDTDRIKMSTSTDGGRTWGAPINTTDNWYGLGGQPVVQPNGTVIVPIPNLVETGLQSFRSTDGGKSWSSVVQVGPITSHPVAGGLRSPPFPSAEVDRNGKVYAAWQDCRFRVGCTANDIVFSTTTDGISWSPVTRIPIDPLDSGADHFIPGLAVDADTSGKHARLALTYYSYPAADCTADTCRLNVGFISSRDGGATWSTPTELAGPMRLDWLPQTTQGTMVGDYISTSFVGRRAFPLFAQARAPRGGLFREAMATIRGGLGLGRSHASARASRVTRPVGPAPPVLRSRSAR